MENLGVVLFSNIYQGRRVLVTGHTGFKGSWLALWLKQMNAQVSGIGLTPDSSPNHWELLGLNISSYISDIRNLSSLRKIINSEQPEIIFHLAAQSLVRESYADPLSTWETNVMGTANLLSVCRETPSVKAIIVVTTDKCYENKETLSPYTESDPLGGYDPYSASKAGVEILTSSFRRSFFNNESMPLVATARAGNVIGGGDWASERLIPDCIRGINSNKEVVIRYPDATRPWQHVFESLNGYLKLGQKLLSGKHEYADSWNFGSDQDSNCTVREVLNRFKKIFPTMEWVDTQESQPHEAKLLSINSDKAKKTLAWQSVWNLEKSLVKTAEWYSSWMSNNEIISELQLKEYCQDAVDISN